MFMVYQAQFSIILTQAITAFCKRDPVHKMRETMNLFEIFIQETKKGIIISAVFSV